MIFFLNSTARVYKDTELNKLSQLLFTDGIFNTQSSSHEAWLDDGDFLVETTGADMNVTARAGSASVNVVSDGKNQQVMIQEDVALAATVATNASIAVRVDAAVLRIDQSVITGDTLNIAGDNAVSLVIVSGNGANALSDAEIAIALSGDSFLRLADINVSLGTTAITTANITDVRSMVEMTRTVKAGFDSVRFHSVQNDPPLSQLSGGEIWWNEADSVLKFYDGETIESLQTQAYDWGYYPPNGVSNNNSVFDYFYENEGLVGAIGSVIQYYFNATGDDGTRMVGQLFTMPDMENPFIQVKMANPLYAQDLEWEIWAVDGSNQPITEVENILALDKNDVPKNDYVDLYLDGSLYTAGVTYLLVIKGTGISYLNTGTDSDYKEGSVYISQEDNDDFFKGHGNGYHSTSRVLTASSLTWSFGSAYQCIMRIAERTQLPINETDLTGQAHEVSQLFTATTRDMINCSFLKADNLGTPTGDITASLYIADDDGNTVGGVLESITMTGADWDAVAENENITFAFSRDDLVIGRRYALVLDADVKSDTDQYRIMFASYANGKAQRYNTVDGWTSLTGDFFFEVKTSSTKKILVLNEAGLVPQEVIDISQFEKISTDVVKGVTTKNLAEATVQQVIPHGLGKTPSKVTLDAMYSSGDYRAWSKGIFDINGQICIYSSHTATQGTSSNSTTFAVRIYGSTSTAEYQTGTITVDDTNIYIDWVLTGSPVGTGQIMWEAE